MPFEDPEGSIAYDISNYGNHGTIYGATRTLGKLRKALSFNGVNNYVDLGDNPNLEAPAITDKLTLEAWVYPRILTGLQFIVGKEGVHKIDLYGARVLFLTGENWAGSMLTSQTALSANVWYHIIATYDGSVKRLYINGIQDPNTVSTSGSVGSNNYHASVGCSYTTIPYREFFYGLIDEVRIYSRALSAKEVYTHYIYGIQSIRRGPTPRFAKETRKKLWPSVVV
jgi:hypothetical protein